MDPLGSADCRHGISRFSVQPRSSGGIPLVDESDRLRISEGLPANTYRITTKVVAHIVGLSATNLEAPYPNVQHVMFLHVDAQLH
jgi:hypothetical protein